VKTSCNLSQAKREALDMQPGLRLNDVVRHTDQGICAEVGTQLQRARGCDENGDVAQITVIPWCLCLHLAMNQTHQRLWHQPSLRIALHPVSMFLRHQFVRAEEGICSCKLLAEWGTCSSQHESPRNEVEVQNCVVPVPVASVFLIACAVCINAMHTQFHKHTGLMKRITYWDI
jgi:hypothetical protein